MKRRKAEVTPALLQRLVAYDPVTGLSTWTERTEDLFETRPNFLGHLCRSWNAKYSGMPAFTRPHNTGYLCGIVLGNRLLAHRVAWAVTFGEWPQNEIDHINGLRTDNRLSNLRDVTREMNKRNVKRQSNNRSGATGVRHHRTGWRARILDQELGVFTDFHEAVAVRKRAEASLNFHHNHGRAS